VSAVRWRTAGRRLGPHRSRDWGFRSPVQGRSYGSVTAGAVRQHHAGRRFGPHRSRDWGFRTRERRRYDWQDALSSTGFQPVPNPGAEPCRQYGGALPDAASVPVAHAIGASGARCKAGHTEASPRERYGSTTLDAASAPVAHAIGASGAGSAEVPRGLENPRYEMSGSGLPGPSSGLWEQAQAGCRSAADTQRAEAGKAEASVQRGGTGSPEPARHT